MHDKSGIYVGGLRLLTAMGAGFCFLFSLVYGAGRGASLIPAGHEGLAYFRIVVYGLILCGALFYTTWSRVALVALLLGLICRSYLELQTSLLKSWAVTGYDIQMGWLLLMFLMYLFNFIFPALLLCEGLRSYRKIGANKSQHPTASS